MSRNRVVTVIMIIIIIGTVAFIWSNSFAGGEESSVRSDSVVDKIKPIIDPQNKIPRETFSFYIRKAAHFSEFFLLGAEIVLLRVIAKKPRIFTMLFAGLSTAVTDESIQIFTGRTDSVKDILLDFSGAVCGMAVVFIICSAVLYLKKRVKS